MTTPSGEVKSYLLRVPSNYDIDWAVHRGCYLDLPDKGERQVSRSLLRNERIIFTTLIPETAECEFGGDSWLMELSAYCGRLKEPPFDLNEDGEFTVIDEPPCTAVCEGGEPVPPGGLKSTEGILPTPAVLSAGETETKYSSGASGGIFTTKENPGGSTMGRKAWRQFN